ncbi:MAG TPA: energy transducer TonB [Thermoanaerobaculia bacterium]
MKNLEMLMGGIQMMETLSTRGTVPNQTIADPWGTPYRLDVMATGYRMIGAGSDRKFDEASWTAKQQFTGLEGDVIAENGLVVRSNRNWLHTQATTAEAAAAEKELSEMEARVAAMRNPLFRNLIALELTMKAMPNVAALQSPDAVDGWGTPYRIDVDGHKVRVVSAGSDRQFAPESWSQPAKADTAEDVIYDEGRFTRRVDREAVWKASKDSLQGEPMPQPVDERNTTTTARRVGGEVKAPVVIKRVDPVYAEEARKARISGIVIVETIITESGDVGDIRLLKSILPAIDLAAMDAVRQWKFQPGTMDGVPVPVIFNLTVNFKLN